jgi:hypothetical protein
VIERDRGRGWSVIGGDGWRDWTRAKFLSVIVLPFLSFVSSLASRSRASSRVSQIRREGRLARRWIVARN